jgi:hypothetical protein
MSRADGRPHTLGAGLGCLMCEAKRREDAGLGVGAVALGLQRPTAERREVSA